MSIWNPTTLAELRALWAEGHTVSEIGRRLDTSKNAIVGKAHRLALPPRPSPIVRDEDPDVVAAAREAAARHWAAGWSIKAIAAAVGRSSHTIAYWAVTHRGQFPPRRMIGHPLVPTGTLPDLSAPDSVVAAIEAVRPIVAPVARVAPAPAPPAPAPRAPLTAACQWLTTDRRPWIACGAPCERGRPYCAEHAARAFVPVRKWERDQRAAISFGGAGALSARVPDPELGAAP